MTFKSALANRFNRLLAPAGVRLVRGGVEGNVWANPTSPELTHSQVYPVATYSPWFGDDDFQRVYASVSAYSLVDQLRMWELWTMAQQWRSVPGHFLEVGAWRGGTSALLGSALRGSGKTIYVADTFEGVVKASAKDTNYRGGEHSDTSQEVVEQLLADANITHYKILRGIFPEETGSALSGPLALVHIDVDVYQSAKDIMDFVTPLMSPEGVIVFDDYGFYGCEGITRLVNEMRASGDWFCLHNLNGHAITMRRLSNPPMEG